MGEVWRATDTKLNRDVAIKVLPESWAQDADRMARFSREAQVLASLNHPNIAAIYGVEEHALVMELVEGEALRGPLPIQTALEYARQIAEALEYAHEKGVVHRDLKPSNIKVTPAGSIKVLDFGLAKVSQPMVPNGNPEEQPTVTVSRAGAVLGTPAYMPPEQATGQPVDRRADIWAFGVVLFEMLSGRRLYPQSSITETLAAVLRDEPRWKELPGNTPTPIRTLLRRCLERDAKRRLRDIGEARIAIEDCLAGKVSQTLEHTKRRLGPVAIVAVLATVLLLAAVEIGRLRFSGQPMPAQTVRYRLAIPDRMKLARSEVFSISPDGKILAYLASDTDQIVRLWIHPLDSLEPRLLPGTEIHGAYPPPFWSPDSKFLAFDAGGKLKKVDLIGSPPVTLCSTTGIVIGGTWNRDGFIIFGNTKGGLMRVSEKGGAAVPVTTMDSTRGEMSQGFPAMLPDGHRFIYSRFSSVAENNGVYVGSLDAQPDRQGLRQLVVTPYSTQFVPRPGGKGRLLFLRDAALWSQDFDTSQINVVGEPVRVAEQVGHSVGFGFFATSAGDHLVYRNLAGQLSQLAWFDRRGNRIGLVGEPMNIGWLNLSPDGTRVALNSFDGIRTNLWVYDLAREERKRLTVDPASERSALWSADGKRLVFSSSRGGHYDLYQMAATGEGASQLLYASEDNKDATSCSPDGKFLVYETQGAATKRDVWILPLEAGNRTAAPLLNTAANESSGAFSPAGRWFAYDSDDSGAYEVYIQEFSPAASAYLVGPRIQISRGGGFDPHWRADGKELFYVAPDRTITAVPIAPGAALRPGIPQRLFRDGDGWFGDPEGNGKRFLFAIPAEQTAAPPFTVVLNWQAELKK